MICDLRMPRLDGVALFESLARAGSPMRDRILFITGDTLSRRTVGFLEVNHAPYLAKPFLVEELQIAVARLLELNDARKKPETPETHISDQAARRAAGKID